jgi:hypothetical protein
MRVRLAVAVLSLAGAAPVARADVTLTFASAEGERFAQQAGVDLEAVKAQIQGELDRLFQVYRLEDYLRAFSDAQAFTTRGLGVDYGSTIKLAEVGIAANVAVNGNDAFTQRDSRTQPVAGVATNITAMAGLNLGFLGLRPVTLFGNYFKKKGTYREFGADLENFGAHLQIRIFGPREETLWSALLQWGGIAITSGLDHARMRLTLGQSFRRTIPLAGGQARVESDNQGSFEMDMRTWSVPLELTTSFRFLYVLSAYGGAGFDFQFGSGSDMRVDLSGTLTGVVPSQNARVAIGSARVVATEQASPSPSKVRGILGLQVNVWLLKLFTQLNMVPDPFVASVAVGARLAW